MEGLTRGLVEIGLWLLQQYWPGFGIVVGLLTVTIYKVLHPLALEWFVKLLCWPTYTALYKIHVLRPEVVAESSSGSNTVLVVEIFMKRTG